MDRKPSFAPLFLFALFLFHGAGLVVATRFFPHVPGKAAAPMVGLAAVFAVAYAVVLAVSYRSVRAGTTEARKATRRGMVLVVVGLGWGAASLAVVLGESKAMLPGLFALAGLVCWYPAFLFGAVLLLAVRR